MNDFQSAVLAAPALADVSQQLAATAEANANFVSVEQVAAGAPAAGLAPAQVDAIVPASTQ